MNYLLMLFADEKAGAAIPHAEMAQWMDKMYAYQAVLEKAGAFVSTSGLAPTSQAKTVSHSDGVLRVEDGPFAETREQLGGFYIIKAESIEEAVRFAALCPAAQWGHIEVRPFAHFE